MHHRLKLGLALLVGLVVGGSVGVMRASRTIGVGSGMMSQWAADATYAQLAELQYRYADGLHARAALSDFLDFAQQMRNAGKVPDPKTLEIAVALAYMRLAALDRHEGNTKGYQSNVSHAQESLRSIGAQHTSVEDMEKFLSKRDSLSAGGHVER